MIVRKIIVESDRAGTWTDFDIILLIAGVDGRIGFPEMVTAETGRIRVSFYEPGSKVIWEGTALANVADVEAYHLEMDRLIFQGMLTRAVIPKERMIGRHNIGRVI